MTQTDNQQRLAGLTKPEFEALKAEKGSRIKIIATDDYQGVFRPATQPEFEVHVAELSRARERGTSLLVPQRNFLRAMLLHEGDTTLDAILTEQPGELGTLYDKVLVLSGAAAEARELTFQ